MDKNDIVAALAALGNRVPDKRPVEILIVGGAAGLLNGELGGVYSTGDVDVLIVLPSKAWDDLQDSAAEVGIELGLPANWMNRDVGFFAESLPSDWELRRFDVGKFGALQVWAIGRADLIAMKFISHRVQDRRHLAEMRPTKAELEFVLKVLDLVTGLMSDGQIEMARHYVQNWE